MTKPASAPPVELRAIAAEMRSHRAWETPKRGIGYPIVADWADRIEALAASAQVQAEITDALAIASSQK